MSNSRNPIDGFQVDPESLRYVGKGLQRPECILAEPNGDLWVADARGGVVCIRPDGQQKLIAQAPDPGFETTDDDARRFTEGTLPNGLAFAANGDLLISNFGTDRLERMTRQGETKVICDTIDGAPIGKVNFVLRDSKDRIWLTISTRIPNWIEAITDRVNDGYIAVLDEHGFRIVADGFAFTNEIRLDANEEWLYVAETTGPHVTRLRVQPDGSLTDRQIFGPSNHGAFIDGIAFDSFGNLWGTHIMVDRVFALTPEGDLRIILDDDNGSEAGRKLMQAFERSQATTELMMAAAGTVAPWTASITFGGADLKRVYIGSLRGTTIPWFEAPVAGLPMVHWKERENYGR